MDFFFAAIELGSHPIGRVALGVVGAGLVFYIFKSLIRVGVLNQQYQDPLAFWVGRIMLHLFRWRIFLLGGRSRRNEIMTWYWPCALIGVITIWFLLVTAGFAMLGVAFHANLNFMEALISSGSALSTLGFSTPQNFAGQVLAIMEGAIGLFLIVYLFTFLPGFMDLIRSRGARVAWIYAHTDESPSGVALLEWHCRNGRAEALHELWEDWGVFFHNLSVARTFLPILCVIRPLSPNQSWACAFGAFLDALALVNSAVDKPTGASRFCFESGVAVMLNTHQAMRGVPVSPSRSPDLVYIKREEYDAACAQLAAAGLPLVADRELAWKRFVEAHMQYEEQVAWLAAAISDPLPVWPKA